MKGRLRGYCMKTCDAIVSKCLWWLTMNGKAHKLCLLKLADDVISGKEDQEDFLEAGLSSVQINQGEKIKNPQSISIWNSWRIWDVYTNMFQQKSTCICISEDLSLICYVLSIGGARSFLRKLPTGADIWAIGGDEPVRHSGWLRHQHVQRSPILLALLIRLGFSIKTSI